ncbi:MAG: alpha/beta hydrolase [Deltaproteobacteria bacterium]|nr:alpha/beta hydrolase [Deltaproteobacteria bacterium]
MTTPTQPTSLSPQATAVLAANHPALRALLRERVWLSTLEAKHVVAQDGTRIAYVAVGRGKKTLLLANGLGGRLYAWLPLIDHLWQDYRLITWDYRGLYDSGIPPRRRMLAIPNHAIDAYAILQNENAKRAVIFGWSMGVQVALELAVTHPETVQGLVLLNGTYGHLLSTVLQPLIAIPGLRPIVHSAIEVIRKQPLTLDTMGRLARVAVPFVARFLALLVNQSPKDLAPLVRQYTEDVLGPSFDNYLYLFQELDAHSAYHVLPAIESPTLLVSGLLDFLTPARQSYAMAHRLPNAEHLPLRRAGHFALLEKPTVVLPAIDRFLSEV